MARPGRCRRSARSSTTPHHHGAVGLAPHEQVVVRHEERHGRHRGRRLRLDGPQPVQCLLDVYWPVRAILTTPRRGFAPTTSGSWALTRPPVSRHDHAAHVQTDLDAISSRIKSIKAIEIIGKVLAIVGVAAFTGGAAGAAVGGALEGAGHPRRDCRGRVPGRVATFTLVSRLDDPARVGRAPASARTWSPTR